MEDQIACRKEIKARLERFGFKEKIVWHEKFGSWTEMEPYSPQWNIRQGNPPKSMDECTLATLEALILQGGIVAWDGDGVSCVAQMVWAQHRRAEKAEVELAELKKKVGME